MKNSMRFIAFMLKNIIVVCVVIALCAAGFFITMNYSNLYVLLNDGMKERANVILFNNDTTNMSQYFTNYFMENDAYIALREQYGSYDINTFGYKMECGSLITWPWASRTTIYIDEAVYSIDGHIDTTVLSKDEAMAAGKYYPPAWRSARYKVVLIKADDQWRIESLEFVSDFNYVQPTQRSLEPDVLASLRPTPTPVVSVQPTTNPSNQPTYPGTVVGVDKQLNIRSGPGTNYEKVGQLKNGDVVQIYSETESWFCIAYNGTKAYVHAQYIEVNDVE